MAEFTIDPNRLPYGIRTFVTTLGAQNAITLLEQYGGECFYVPSAPNDDHEVVKIFGKPLVMQWCATYGDKVYQVPKCSKILYQQRDHTIQTALKNGTDTVMALARQFGLTRQRIMQIGKAQSPYETNLPAKNSNQLQLLGL